MTKRPQMVKIDDVKPVKFEGVNISVDGKTVIFHVKDKAGNLGHISLDWRDLGTVVTLIEAGAEQARDVRRQQGETDAPPLDESFTGQLVSGFVTRGYDQHGTKGLSFLCANGLRFDFVISSDMTDESGKSLLKGIADSLVTGLEDKPPRSH